MPKKITKFGTPEVVLPKTMVHNGKVIRKLVTKSGAPRKIGGKPAFKIVQSKGSVVSISSKGEKVHRKESHSNPHHAKKKVSGISASNIVEGKRARKPKQK